jgi:phosphoribosylaminoimidazolecarboxamide formyltransferase/IMP cyclohydrolase
MSQIQLALSETGVFDLGSLAGIVGTRNRQCKYGENPYQKPAFFFAVDDSDPLAAHRFEVVDGQLPSFINTTDGDRALQVLTHAVAGFEKNFREKPLMAIAVKHGNPCGMAIGDDPEAVLLKTIMGDQDAVHGAVMMTNIPITVELAKRLRRYKMPKGQARLLNGIAAPSIDSDAYPILGRKDGQHVLLENFALGELSAKSMDKTPLIRQVRGGFLLQPNYSFVLKLVKAQLYGKELTSKQQRDVVLAWAICYMSNSNSISIVKNLMLIGNGTGQQDRVSCCRLAVEKAIANSHSTKEASAASDSFFPFPDGVMVLIKAGVRVINPTLSGIHLDQVIAACRAHNRKLIGVTDADGRGFAWH